MITHRRVDSKRKLQTITIMGIYKNNELERKPRPNTLTSLKQIEKKNDKGVVINNVLSCRLLMGENLAIFHQYFILYFKLFPVDFILYFKRIYFGNTL